MKILLAQFRQGSGAMAQNAIDFYKTDKGILRHSWGMGGSSEKMVSKMPLLIDGYVKLKREE